MQMLLQGEYAKRVSSKSIQRECPHHVLVHSALRALCRHVDFGFFLNPYSVNVRIMFLFTRYREFFVATRRWWFSTIQRGCLHHVLVHSAQRVLRRYTEVAVLRRKTWQSHFDERRFETNTWIRRNIKADGQASPKPLSLPQDGQASPKPLSLPQDGQASSKPLSLPRR